MRKELEAKLVKKAPNLYQAYGGDMRVTCMHWGMDCGDGWYQLLWELSSKLEPLIVKFKEGYPDKLYPHAAQVKEKWGALRFYMNFATDEIFDIIEDYESRSQTICELCGGDGLVRHLPWVRTLCLKCYDKVKK